MNNKKKFRKISTVLIWSENWRKLASWYEDVLELKNIEEINHPKDTGILYEFPQGGPWLWIGQHSEIKGESKDPLRIMLNVNVDSVAEVYDYLLSKKVRILAKPFKAPTFDKYFVTFYDPDGNILQLIGDK